MNLDHSVWMLGTFGLFWIRVIFSCIFGSLDYFFSGNDDTILLFHWFLFWIRQFTRWWFESIQCAALPSSLVHTKTAAIWEHPCAWFSVPGDPPGEPGRLDSASVTWGLTIRPELSKILSPLSWRVSWVSTDSLCPSLSPKQWCHRIKMITRIRTRHLMDIHM